MRMAVADQRIIVICEDNTINSYDVATGVLRLTLKAPRPVTKVVPSQDGSIIFCAHQGSHMITLWDTQTGV